MQFGILIEVAASRVAALSDSVQVFLRPSAGALCRGCRSEALCDSRGGQVGSNDAFRSGIILNIAPTRSQQPLVQSRLQVILVISF
jgi:hypothetical protein